MTIDNIGPLELIELSGTFNYKIADQQITFSAGSVSVVLYYNFPDSNTLVLTNNADVSITLTKIQNITR